MSTHIQTHTCTIAPQEQKRAYRARDHKLPASKPRGGGRRRGYTCTAAERPTESQTPAQIALSHSFPTQQPEVLALSTSYSSHLDMAKVYNNIMYTPCHNQSIWATDEEKAAYVESVTKNNPAWIAFLRQEEEEWLEDYWERREHEAEMRLAQSEARRAAIRLAEIEAEHLRATYPSFPRSRWHESDDDLDESWW